MNWVDLLILAAAGLAVYNGFRRGALMQVFSWGGFILGLLVGGIASPWLVHIIDPRGPMARAVTTLVSFLTIAFLIEGLVAFGGSRVVRRITNVNALKVNAAAGSIVAASMAVLVAWFLSVPAKRVPELASAVKGSTILRGVYGVLSTPPDFLAGIGTFLSRTGFPEVFAQLNPSLAPPVDPPPAALARDREVLRAARLTFKIQGVGCGGQVNGSGFPVDGDTIITAAHVVAGTRGITVLQAQDAGGDRFRATVVYIDTDTDIAVLFVPALPNARLRVVDDPARPRTDGAAIGYPGGGARKISVARVRARTEALGRDIYSRRAVSRDIYVLRAEVRQGNSGGPFVDTDGRVRGMVFAASADNPEESYALAETEIDRAIRRAGDRRRSVSTGRCAI